MAASDYERKMGDYWGGPFNVLVRHWGAELTATIRENTARNQAEGRAVEIEALFERN